jgi:hypothetical protein
MAYVDLDPLRAATAKMLEESDYTSVQERIVQQAKITAPQSALANRVLPYDVASLPRLLPLSDRDGQAAQTPSAQSALPCTLGSYLTLLEWTGRQLRHNKRGALAPQACSVLAALGIDEDEWQNTVR